MINIKNLIFIFALFAIIYSCSKKESTPSVTPPIVIKLSGCDSIKQGLLKTTSDSVRLVSCMTITSCDSVRFGILKPNTQDTLRLLTCIKISTDDSMRLGLLKIGQKYQGGIIAYFLVSGDPGFDANIKHGLIAATEDQSTGIRWYNGTNTTTGATKTAIGSGLSNTNTIITSQGEPKTSYAAGLARAYTGGGYTDWYLPSKDELNVLYLNRIAIGGFTVNKYWSSTEVLDNFSVYAWIQGFANGMNGLEGSGPKNFLYYVRAVRAF